MSALLDQIRSSVRELPAEERRILTAELIEGLAMETNAARAAEIDEVLLSRSEGPFIPFDPNDESIWKGLQDEALRRVAEGRHA